MAEKAKVKHRLVISRAVLLVEIERRCADPACAAKMRLGLTKEEARAYTGFKCERCEQTWDDALAERDIPDWWEELFVIKGASASQALNGLAAEPEGGEAAPRLSAADRGRAARDESGGDRIV